MFLKPDTFLVIDDISLAPRRSGDKPDVDWLLQTVTLPQMRASDHYVVEGEKAALDVIKCTPGHFEMSAGGPRSNAGYMMPAIFRKTHYVSIHSTAPVIRTAMVTLIHCRSKRDAPAAKPQVRLQGNVVTIRVRRGWARPIEKITVDLSAALCQVHAK